MSSLSEIAYEQIHGNYWYASYLDLKVVMMKSNGYINASKLCTDGGKRFDHWLENKHSQQMLNYYQTRLNQIPSTNHFSSAGIPADEGANHFSNAGIQALEDFNTIHPTVTITGGKVMNA